MSLPDLAVFSSWSGRYSDNPRAIGEELQRRGVPMRHVWLLDGAAGPVPPYVEAVAPDGPASETLLAQAPLIVSNDVLAHAFRKSAGTRYLQTWHGTPLKRIAHDVARPSFPEARNYETWLPRDVSRWDVLISPNRYSTEILRRAFRFGGEIVETGYPRNDILQSPERDAVRARVRRELGIPDGVRAVLYAPTWRDPDPFRLELDLGAVRRAFCDDCVVLVRAHWLVAGTAELAPSDGVLQVSGHQDVRELYLAADVLVTDYSSVMFDFAITGKPMLFYVYDLPWFRDEVRGFYFDLESQAPGPLLTTTRDVVRALEDLDALGERYAEAYARFRDRFCHLEDGRASARAVDVLLGLAAAAAA